MADLLRITALDIEPAPAELRSSGLRAFLRVELNDAVTIDGLTLRTTRDGRDVIMWPERRGRRKVVAPKPHVRAELETEILVLLRAKGHVA